MAVFLRRLIVEILSLLLFLQCLIHREELFSLFYLFQCCYCSIQVFRCTDGAIEMPSGVRELPDSGDIKTILKIVSCDNL